jgi:hypothetical protein
MLVFVRPAFMSPSAPGWQCTMARIYLKVHGWAPDLFQWLPVQHQCINLLGQEEIQSAVVGSMKDLTLHMMMCMLSTQLPGHFAGPKPAQQARAACHATSSDTRIFHPSLCAATPAWISCWYTYVHCAQHNQHPKRGLAKHRAGGPQGCSPPAG